jgi:hypothetical protein
MPRLSTKQYLDLHNYLRHLWLEHKQIYSLLQPNQQWDLHEFFAPTEDLGPEQLLAHRKQAAAAASSLPQSAGRAFKELDLIMAGQKRPHTISVPAGRQGHLHAHPLVNPDIDYEKLARAFVAAARRG